MEEKAIRGVPWTVLTYAANKGITFATTVVLARLLVPSDFGLIALATLAVGLIGLFRDLGLGGALVLRQDLDDRAKGTVLTMMLGTGVIVAGAIAALAPLMAELFDEPRLRDVLIVLGLSVTIGAVGWFYESLLQRELEFRRRFIAQFVQAVVYAAVALTLAAAFDAGVWSLVAGQLAAIAVFAVLLVYLAPYRVRPAWDRAAAIDVFRTGRGFLLQGGLAFVQQNADYFAVGRLLGTAPLGFYSMAYRLGELPYMSIADPIAKVTFPGFARMLHRGEDIAQPYLNVLRLVALVTVPVGVLMSATAGPFTEALFGDKWLPMVGALSIFGIWASVRAVQTTIAWLLNSVGQAGLMGVISVGVLLPLIPGLLIAADRGGIEAVSWVMLADMTLSLCVLAYVTQRKAGISLRRQLGALAPVLGASPFCWAAGRVVAETVHWPNPWLGLVASVAAGMAAYAAVITLVDPGLLRHAAGQVGRTFGRAPAPA